MDKLERLKKEIELYKEKITEYKNGNIDHNIKGIRSVMGVYMESEKENYMTRIKIPAGIIELKQLEEISKIADKYSHGKIHVTTRQDIQFHKVNLEDTVKIMEDALKLNIDTLGAGGNTARNVVCSPLSGVDRHEVFDVSDYALEVSKYLLNDSSTLKLPRKFKISFSNNSLDTGNATISDLGFIAKIQNNKKGFKVYGGGGLGGAPLAALKLEDFIQSKDVLYYVKAMKELFEEHGDRENRNKARVRHIVHRLGEDKFKELFKYYIEKIKNQRSLDLEIDRVENKKVYDNEFSEPLVNSSLVKEQKQKGYYSVYVHPQNGYITTENLNKILDYIKGLNYKTSIRLTNTQGFFIRDLKGKDVDRFLGIISYFTSDVLMENSVTCVGSKVCGIGLCNSKGLLSEVYEKFSDSKYEIKKLLPRIFISGCPNSCGQHQIGKISFSGKVKKTQEGMVPTYNMYFGGIIEDEKTKFAGLKGEISAKRVPQFLYDLANLTYELRYDNFDKFIEEQWIKVENLIKEFQLIECSNINSDLYYDFDCDFKFLSKK